LIHVNCPQSEEFAAACTVLLDVLDRCQAKVDGSWENNKEKRAESAVKSILVQLSGTERDSGTLACALAAAEPFAAHLTCLRVEANPLALARSFVGFDPGSALTVGDAICDILAEQRVRTERAEEHFLHFCNSRDIARQDVPPAPHHVTACLQKVEGDEVEVLIQQARVHDLVVVPAGSPDKNGVRRSELAALALGAGRPVLLAPDGPSTRHFRTIAVAWKNRPEPARAITASMPLLQQANRVVIFGATEHHLGIDSVADGLHAAAQYLRWHRVEAEPHVLAQETTHIAQALLTAAAEVNADLLVMGAYGHGRLRELVLGGVTHEMLKGVALPLLVMH
jgi:nucleotide-binding universal stress UspA family protein